MANAIDVGLRGEARLTVADGDTAISRGTGGVPVLATPCVVALCEQAAISAIKDRLPAGMTTVGMRVQIDHLQPTAVGHEVRAEAVLRYVEGRKMIFAVSVDDDRGLVAAGKVIRVVVDKERFMAKTV
jgi:predicted thioesterase